MFVFDVLRIAGGCIQFCRACIAPPSTPLARGVVVKFSHRCCCVLQPPVILCRAARKLITDFSKKRHCLEKSLSDVVPVDTA